MDFKVGDKVVIIGRRYFNGDLGRTGVVLSIHEIEDPFIRVKVRDNIQLEAWQVHPDDVLKANKITKLEKVIYGLK